MNEPTTEVLAARYRQLEVMVVSPSDPSRKPRIGAMVTKILQWAAEDGILDGDSPRATPAESVVLWDTPLARDRHGRRVVEAFDQDGVSYVGDLTTFTETELLEMPSIGPKSLALLKGLLARYGLDFRRRE